MKKPETRIRTLETNYVTIEGKDIAQATLSVYCPATGISASTKRTGKKIGQAVNRCLGWFHSGKWNKEPATVEPAVSAESPSFAELEQFAPPAKGVNSLLSSHELE